MSIHGGTKHIEINWRWPSVWSDVEMEVFLLVTYRSKKYMVIIFKRGRSIKWPVGVINNSSYEFSEFIRNKYEKCHVRLSK